MTTKAIFLLICPGLTQLFLDLMLSLCHPLMVCDRKRPLVENTQRKELNPQPRSVLRSTDAFIVNKSDKQK